MSVLLNKFHTANTYENLADFFLSFIGISNPPRRQFDHGYDFYCYISETLPENDELLRFDNPFNIQIKSTSGLSVTYGKEFEKWKAEDIDWLFKHQTPFFIGFIDPINHQLSIHDTTGIWFLYVYEKRECSRITFQARAFSTELPAPTSNANRNDLMRNNPTAREIKGWGNSKGGGIEYIIDLGNPIVTISMEDIKDPVKLSIIKRTLRAAIELEKINIANREIGINFFQEIKHNMPNNDGFFFGATFNEHKEPYKQKLLNSLKDALISLQVNANHHKEFELEEALANVLKLFPEKYYDQQLYASNPSLFRWVKNQA